MSLQKIEFFHFEELVRNGYTLDMLFLLSLANEGHDIMSLCGQSLKLEAICQGMFRKSLITAEGSITLSGKELLSFSSTSVHVSLKKRKPSVDQFATWWKTYPGTDTFTYRGSSFTGTRSLRTKQEECKLKLHKILEEGEYTLNDLIEALQYEIFQKKENSIKSKINKLTYMQNSLTYLNQRSFEPFIELVKEGHKITENHAQGGSTDI